MKKLFLDDYESQLSVERLLALEKEQAEKAREWEAIIRLARPPLKWSWKKKNEKAS